MAISASTASDGFATTTNADATSIGIVMVPPSGIVHIACLVVAKSMTNIHAGWHLEAFARRNSTSAPVIIGSVVNTIAAQKDAGASAWTATLAVSGNNIVARVTGAAGVTINWLINILAKETTL